jgi:hypothetical protein
MVIPPWEKWGVAWLCCDLFMFHPRRAYNPITELCQARLASQVWFGVSRPKVHLLRNDWIVSQVSTNGVTM